MEEILETRFQRVEAALQTLIDSITTYNPSPPAAVELVAADDSLSEGLEQCMSDATGDLLQLLTLPSSATSIQPSPHPRPPCHCHRVGYTAQGVADPTC